MIAPQKTILTIADVALILGPSIKPKTVSTYLTESRPSVGRDNRPGRYVDHPFPEPDGRIGRAPWWDSGREGEIRAWAEARAGQGSRSDLATT